MNKVKWVHSPELNNEQLNELHKNDEISAINYNHHNEIIFLGTKSGKIFVLSAIKFKCLFTYFSQKV